MNEKCICLESVECETADDIVKLKCGHFYHTKCVADWIIAHGTCPHCRKHDGFEREENAIVGVPASYSIESYNVLMMLVIALHCLGFLMASIPTAILYFNPEAPEPVLEIINTMCRSYGVMIEVIHMTLTLILCSLISNDCHKYVSVGYVCHNYVCTMYFWSMLMIGSMFISFSLPSVSLPVSILMIISDICMHSTYSVFIRTVFTSITYIQRV